MNASLIKDFTVPKVKEAIFNMNSLRSPGPDGFRPSFYQNHWETVGPGVSFHVLEVLNEGK